MVWSLHGAVPILYNILPYSRQLLSSSAAFNNFKETLNKRYLYQIFICKKKTNFDIYHHQHVLSLIREHTAIIMIHVKTNQLTTLSIVITIYQDRSLRLKAIHKTLLTHALKLMHKTAFHSWLRFLLCRHTSAPCIPLDHIFPLHGPAQIP